MIVEINYTNAEKQKIESWKRGLPPSSLRTFAYGFIENGKEDDDGFKLFKFLIKSDDGHTMRVADDVVL